MKRALLLLVLLGCSRSPAPSGQAAPEAAVPAEGDGAVAAAEVRLAPPGEPGQQLVVAGVLVRAEDRTPIAGHRFRIYQADTAGDYRASNPADERTARLSADVTTDAAGRFAIRTIVPGVYGTPPGDPHLHIQVSGAEPSMHVVYFDRFLQESTIRWAKATEQAHIVTLAAEPDGTLAGHLSLPVRGVGR